jgi:hypothetical protein
MQAKFGALVSPFSAPQAKSQQELDDYLDVIAATHPATTVPRVEEFALKYPKSF